MKIILYAARTIFFSFLYFTASAQVAFISVRGKVSDERNKPLEYAVVSLRQGAAMIGNTLTDSTGYFQFTHLQKGKYTCLFSFVSYKDTLVPVTINNDTLINLQFQNNRLLKAAEVHAKKPIIQMEIDRLRFNVSGTDLIYGNNIWDVIEKTPLVTASQDGSIQISGTSGAVVYINNRRKVLSGMALKAYLSAMPADNLDAIEVITTPSSRYEAEGGAGILNIVTKKKKNEGFDGSLVLSDRQTALNSQSGSLFLNDRKGKWDVYTTMYGVDRQRKPESIQDFNFSSVAGNTGPLTSNINTTGPTRTLSSGANLGVDYQIDRNQVVGMLFDYSGSWDKKTRDAYTHDYYATTDSLAYSNNIDKLNSNTFSLNLNYEGKLDSTGKKLNVDLDGLRYTSSYHSISKTDALDLLTDKVLYNQDYFRSSSPQQVSNVSLKADYKWPLGKGTSLEFGGKISFSEITDDLVFENYAGNNRWIRDSSRSNLFKYDEHINAVYGVLNHRINAKWSFQTGIRLENTVARGYLESVNVVDRNYTNAFPTVFLKYSPSKKKSYGLSVSSRITRPSFWDVNPFRSYTTDKTYFEGNPFLLPSRYYREELSHTLNSKSGNYTFQLAANQTIDEFFSLPFQDTGNVVVYKKVNYGNKHSYTAAAIYNNQLLPWWQLASTVLTGFVMTHGAYEDVPIDNKTFLLSISTNQGFTISKRAGLTATLIVNNTLPFTMVNTRIGDRLETELRIRKSAGPFNITLAGTDFFKSNKDRYRVVEPDLIAVENFYYDTRSVALTLSYNFGKSTIGKNRDRDTQFQDIKGRIM